tara:strand:- start:1009 stop:1380 length:372 start_codon:yes stop_codon:yes gene_type:complete
MTKTEEYKAQIINIVNKQRLFFFSDIFAYTTFTRITAYNHKLNEDEEILQLLDKHKIETKHSMRNKWYNSQNPLLQLALYKIIGDEEEYYRIANAKQQIDANVRQEQPLFHINESNDNSQETS